MSEPAHPDEIASPCIGVCELDEGHGCCRGCWRTLADIAQWSRATADQRREILARAAATRAFREHRRLR